jgi:3-oxoacyl-[acyl-carrier-protein] synthase II
MQRVVVTGLGLVCPVGNSTSTAWQNLVAGRSGIASIKEWKEMRVHGEPLPVTYAGQLKGFIAEDYVEPKKDVRRMARFMHLAMAAASEAWKQAGLPATLEGEQSERAGAIVGVGLSGIDVIIHGHNQMFEKGPGRLSPFSIPGAIANLAPGRLAIKYNLRGANYALSSACTSGSHAIGESFMRIRLGLSDVMLCGGSEAALHPVAVCGFHAMRALAVGFDECAHLASRPFDKDRRGFVMGEGAGILVLESLEHARRRGAEILAEMVGYGNTCDAFHITQPPEGGEASSRAMEDALAMGELLAEHVDYINAHGTSTYFNDMTETKAIKAVFGPHAYRLMVSSSKSMTGHLLGAAGGVEAVFSILSLVTGVVPPTINYQTPDDDCDLDYVPNEARRGEINVVLSNSFGFGGTNAVLAFKKFSG